MTISTKQQALPTNETETVKNIADVSGQYSVTEQLITVILPFNVLGLPVVYYNDTMEMATFPVELPVRLILNKITA